MKGALIVIWWCQQGAKHEMSLFTGGAVGACLMVEFVASSCRRWHPDLPDVEGVAAATVGGVAR